MSAFGGYSWIPLSIRSVLQRYDKPLYGVANVSSTNRLVTSGVYYGLGFNSGSLAGEFYLNFAASGLVEIPAYILAAVLVNK